MLFFVRIYESRNSTRSVSALQKTTWRHQIYHVGTQLKHFPVKQMLKILASTTAHNYTSIRTATNFHLHTNAPCAFWQRQPRGTIILN